MGELSHAVCNPRRSAALQSTGLLDSPHEEAFDRLTRLVSKTLHVPVVLLSLVDERREFFKSQIGLPEPWASRRETPLSHSLCQHTVVLRAPFVVGDARQHALVRDNLAVRALGVVAYAGIPLTMADGQVLGALCAIDTQPRAWTTEEIDILSDLTAAVITEIEARTKTREAQRQAEVAEHERRGTIALVDAIREGIYGIDLDGRCAFVNQTASHMLGYTPPELLGQSMHQTIHARRPDGAPYPSQECPILRACQAGQAGHIEEAMWWRRDGSCLPVECASAPIIEHGALTGAVVTFSAITQRTLAVRRLALQQAVSDVLAHARTFAAAAPKLLSNIGAALQWQMGAMWIVDEDAGVLRCLATWRAPAIVPEAFETATRQMRLAYGMGLPGSAWASGEPIWSGDVLREVDDVRAASATTAGLQGLCVFPCVAAQPFWE